MSETQTDFSFMLRTYVSYFSSGIPTLFASLDLSDCGIRGLRPAFQLSVCEDLLELKCRSGAEDLGSLERHFVPSDPNAVYAILTKILTELKIICDRDAAAIRDLDLRQQPVDIPVCFSSVDIFAYFISISTEVFDVLSEAIDTTAAPRTMEDALRQLLFALTAAAPHIHFIASSQTRTEAYIATVTELLRQSSALKKAAEAGLELRLEDLLTFVTSTGSSNRHPRL